MGDWDQILQVLDNLVAMPLKSPLERCRIVAHRLPLARHLSFDPVPAPLENHPSCELSSPLAR